MPTSKPARNKSTLEAIRVAQGGLSGGGLKNRVDAAEAAALGTARKPKPRAAAPKPKKSVRKSVSDDFWGG